MSCIKMNLSTKLGQDPYQLILSNLSLRDIESLYLSGEGNNKAISIIFQSNHYWSERLQEFGLNPVFNAQRLYHIALIVPKKDLLLTCMKIESILFTNDTIQSYDISPLKVLKTAVKSGSSFIFKQYINLKQELARKQQSKLLTVDIIPITDLTVRDQIIEAFLGEGDGQEYKKELANVLSLAVIKRKKISQRNVLGLPDSELSQHLLDLILYRPKLLLQDPIIFAELVTYYEANIPDYPKNVELLVKALKKSKQNFDGILLIIAIEQGDIKLFQEKLPHFKALADVWKDLVISALSLTIGNHTNIIKLFFDSEGVNWPILLQSIIAYSIDTEIINLLFNNYEIDKNVLEQSFIEALDSDEVSVEILIALAKTKQFKKLNKKLLLNAIKHALEFEGRKVELKKYLKSNGIEYLLQ